MNEAAVRPSLAASDAALGWCLRGALAMEQQGRFERSARWAHAAASTAAEYGHSALCSEPLESLLTRLAARVDSRPPPGRPLDPSRATRWLHVFSLSSAIGGHTAIARRWIARNPLGQQHSVVLTSQPQANVDPGLAEAVRRSGGGVQSLAKAGAFLERAAALRRLAWEHADVVVLHAHMWDVLPSLAFGVPGGPPVLLVNHADHAFWVGCAVADVVVDIRDSAHALTTTLRGARGAAVLPVPLEDHGPAVPSRAAAAARLRDPALLDRGPVLLTVGSPHKYYPRLNLNFPEAIVRILNAIDDCVLIAVGPSPHEPLWEHLARISEGRIVAIGLDPDLAPWHAAADVYLEGFPIGSYTALLEAALAGMAFVRKPYLMPPSVLPVDRGALAAFAPPADLDAYVAAVCALAADPARRAAQAQAARAAVLATHCGEAWAAQLAALQSAVPIRHDVGLGFAPPAIPGPLADYWAALHANHQRAPLAFAGDIAKEQGVWP